MYSFNSPEHALLRAYYAASALLHESKIAHEPMRSVLLANGHIEKKPHPAGGFGYQITPLGREEYASILPPSPPSPTDLELQRGVELKKKLWDETITLAEKVELTNIVLRRINL